jgi:catechol-2,3-dioxygenase
MLDFVESPHFAPAVEDPNTPPWVKHIAMRVGAEADLAEIKRRVEASGLKVDGPIDRGRNVGVYFFDPFGNRLEVMFERQPMSDSEKAKNYEVLDRWEKVRAESRP